MQQEEIWKDIPEHEGMYQVSNLGRVKSLPRKGRLSERVLKCTFDKNTGYLKIGLSKSNKKNTFYIHQLVAMAFLNHKPKGCKIVVDHLNSIKTDNRRDNLRLVTVRENSSKDKKNKTSKYTGVSWNKKAKKWHSQMYVNGKGKHLGYFTSELEAHQAYQKALNSL